MLWRPRYRVPADWTLSRLLVIVRVIANTDCYCVTWIKSDRLVQIGNREIIFPQLVTSIRGRRARGMSCPPLCARPSTRSPLFRCGWIWGPGAARLEAVHVAIKTDSRHTPRFRRPGKNSTKDAGNRTESCRHGCAYSVDAHIGFPSSQQADHADRARRNFRNSGECAHFTNRATANANLAKAD